MGGLLRRLAPRTVKKTLVFALGLMLAAQLVVKVFAYQADVDSEYRHAEETNLELARATAATFRAFVEDVLHQELAIGQDVLADDAARVQAHLGTSAYEYPSVRFFAWLDEHGKVMGLGPSGMGRTLELISGRVLEPVLKGRDWLLTDLIRGDDPNESYFLIARSIRDTDNTIRGVVVAVVNPDALAHLFVERVGGASVALLDQGGRAVFRHPAVDLPWERRHWLQELPGIDRALRGTPTTGTYRSPVDGIEKVIAFVPVTRIGWVALTARPKAEILWRIRTAAAAELLTTLVVAFGAFGVALLLGRRITKPLTQLKEEAAAVGAGELQRRVEVDGPAELQELAATLNLMAARLEDRERRLEEQTEHARELAIHADRHAAHLRLVLENMPEGVLLADAPDGRVTVANSAARELLGRAIPAGTQIDTDAERFGLGRPDGKPYAPGELPISRALSGERVVRQEVVVRQESGASVTVMVNCVPLVIDGRIEGAVAVFQDVTPLKQIERLREEFVHLVSHDLRNPVSVVQSHAELLERRGNLSEERDKKSVTAILLAARRLGSLAGDLLESARLASGKLVLARRPISMGALLQRQVDGLLPELQERVKVELSPELPQVFADPDRLERIVSNLVGNALKYSDGEVVVSAASHGSELVVAVADQGPGISPEAQARLFERYYRVPETARREGLGLGLYITRMFVEAHGGRIWVESEQGHGSIFKFSLPDAVNAGAEIHVLADRRPGGQDAQAS